jgi:hypothetical protein
VDLLLSFDELDRNRSAPAHAEGVTGDRAMTPCVVCRNGFIERSEVEDYMNEQSVAV